MSKNKKKTNKKVDKKKQAQKNQIDIDIYSIIDLIKNNKLIVGGAVAILLIFIVVLASLNNKNDIPGVSENREIIDLGGFGEGAGLSGNNIIFQYEGEQGNMPNMATDNNSYYDTNNGTAVNQSDGTTANHATSEATEPINVTLEENETTIIGNVTGDTSSDSTSSVDNSSSTTDDNSGSSTSDSSTDDSDSFTFELPFVPADEL